MESWDLLAQARAAYAARDWITAREHYRAVDDAALVDGDDLYALANCSWWLGELDDALPALQRAYRSYLDEQRPRTAALVALDTGYTFALRGDEAQGSGWLSRAARLLEDEPPCAEASYLVYLAYEQAVDDGDLGAAMEHAEAVEEAGRAYGDPTLGALGVLGKGRVLVARGEVGDGLALLDEAMVAATSDELDPGWAGNIYCNLMLTCWELADWARAAEWTSVTSRWCASMPGAGPFQGICRVHRAQVLHARGEWSDAETEARRVCDELAGFVPVMVGEAQYALGDLYRQRGELDAAEVAYTEAHRLGRDPCPGLALLRLAQGRTDAASRAIERALVDAGDATLARARLLPAVVSIRIATGDLDGASAAATQLHAIAEVYGTPGLHAQADAARGAATSARGEPGEAIALLERALASCRRARLPYDTACVRLLLAEAHRELHNTEDASLEQHAAQRELDALGAVAPPRGRSAEPPDPGPSPRDDGLSPREVEILGLLAQGRSNQELAEELYLSVRTVERHLATAYRKLGLSGRSARAAAVRYAVEQGITDT